MTVNVAFLQGTYCFIVLSCGAGIYFLIETIRAIWSVERKDRLKFSIILKYYFWMLLFISILMFTHSSTMLLIWKNNLKFPFLPFFVTGTMDSSIMITHSFTSFILTLDRCLIILLEAKYNQRWTLMLLCASILINITVSGANVIMDILFHNNILPEGCVAYGCVLHINTQLVYTYIRGVGSILGIGVGILFLVTILWLRKNKPVIGNKMKSVAEAVVFRAVILGFCCDFGPHIFDAVVISITGDTPFRYIGPYSRVLMAIDIILNSAMNWFIFMKMNAKVSTTQLNNTTTTRNN